MISQLLLSEKNVHRISTGIEVSRYAAVRVKDALFLSLEFMITTARSARITPELIKQRFALLLVLYTIFCRFLVQLVTLSRAIAALNILSIFHFIVINPFSSLISRPISCTDFPTPVKQTFFFTFFLSLSLPPSATGDPRAAYWFWRPARRCCLSLPFWWKVGSVLLLYSSHASYCCCSMALWPRGLRCGPRRGVIRVVGGTG